VAIKAIETTVSFCFLISLYSCSGLIDGPGGADVQVGASSVRFECKPGDPTSATNIARLTAQEYRLTLKDLLSRITDTATAEAALAAAASGIAALPADSTSGYAIEDLRGAAFRGLDHTVSQSHVDAYYQVATVIGDTLTATSERLGALLGECATDAATDDDPACVEAFIRRVGGLALRRPLEEDEVAFLRDTVYADDEAQAASAVDAASVRDVLAALLSAPGFLYHIEDHGQSIKGKSGQYRLSAFELASRLSYLFWQTMPDESLLAAAEDGSLLDEDVYRAQVERVFDDPRTEATLRGFYSEWLKLDVVPHPESQVGDPRYDVFAGDTVPTAQLRQHMIDEVLDLALYYSQSEGGTLSDLFTTDRSFAKDADLAAIYGVAPWDGQGEPPRLTDGERSGILTRAALLLAEGVDTHPVLKGVLIRRNILCDSLPPPPPNVNRDSDMEPPYTRREFTDNLTMQPGSSCSVCHQIINPLGFVTERFDGLGRLRSEERFILTDGSMLASLPIDTHVTPQVVLGDTTTIDSGVELGRMIAESGKAHACFARHYYRYARRQVESLADDGCALEDLRVALEGGSLRDALISVALHPSFKIRRLGD
jgi:hypothetical protein